MDKKVTYSLEERIKYYEDKVESYVARLANGEDVLFGMERAQGRLNDLWNERARKRKALESWESYKRKSC